MSKFIQTQCGSLVNVDSISSIQQDEKYVSEDSFCTFTLYEIVNFINSNIDYVLNSNVNYNLKPRKNWNLLIKKATKK